MTSPTVSVVMSVFNGEAFLREAVESILAQTFTDFEFIIVDDGSTDRTAEILSDYAKRDNRVCVVTQENRGRAESLNRGIDLARAPLLARMDADDISLPHRLKEQVDFLNSHPEVGLLGGAYSQMDPTGRIFGTVRAPLDDSEIRTRMLQENPMCHPAVVMRRDTALRSDGYRKALLDVDDYDLWLRVAERTQLANLDTVVLQYRIHFDQVSIRHVEQQMICFLAARAAHSIRRRGGGDPLSEVDEITPELLVSLGVSQSEIQQAIRKSCVHRMHLLLQADPDSLLRFMDTMPNLGSAQQALPAEMLLSLAGVQYRNGQIAKAIASAGRAALAEPVETGRILRMALTRRIAPLRS